MKRLRVLFPATGFTADDFVRVYEQLAPVLLPRLKGLAARSCASPMRFTASRSGRRTFRASLLSGPRPPVPRKHEPGAIRYISIPDARTLRWAASIGCVEIHSFLHRFPYLTSPTVIAFDLDPGPGKNILDCCEVALLLRAWFGDCGLDCFPKVSGSRASRYMSHSIRLVLTRSRSRLLAASQRTSSEPAQPNHLSHDSCGAVPKTASYRSSARMKFSNLPKRKRRAHWTGSKWTRQSGCGQNCAARWNIRRKPNTTTSAGIAASGS
jgi:DNA primase